MTHTPDMCDEVENALKKAEEKHDYCVGVLIVERRQTGLLLEAVAKFYNAPDESNRRAMIAAWRAVNSLRATEVK
jgi:hypothetical protein